MTHVTRTTSPIATTQASPPGLYISTPEGISRLDVQTRQMIWHTPFPIKDRGKFAPYLVLIGNTVYVASSNSRLLAFDAQRGTMRWPRSLDTTFTYTPYLYMADALLYVSVFPNNTLYALNPADVTIKATLKVPQGLWATVVDGTLYYSSVTDLYAVKIAGEKQLWHQQVGQKQILGAPSVHNGIVYIEATDFTNAQKGKGSSELIYAFDARTGEELWQSPSIPHGAGTIITDERIYTFSSTDGLFAFDTHTHRLIWHRQINTYNVEVADGVVYVYSYNAYTNPSGNMGIFALRATDGQTIWHKKIPGEVYILGIHRGVLYVVAWSADNGAVYALKASDGPTIWQMQTGGDLRYREITVA